VVIRITVTPITLLSSAIAPGDIPPLALDLMVKYFALSSSGKGDRESMCLAIPGQIMELIDPVNQIAKVDVVGVKRNINVSLLADDNGGAQPGDWVLIHVGFALSRVDEEEAHATLRLVQQMGAEYEAELEELKASVIE
jgi:hydrogenase expression/formation protein HypC